MARSVPQFQRGLLDGFMVLLSLLIFWALFGFIFFALWAFACGGLLRLPANAPGARNERAARTATGNRWRWHIGDPLKDNRPGRSNPSRRVLASSGS
jgi:hypothetical protein